MENFMSIDFKILKRANLTQEEFGRLLGVSRVTVNKWIHEGTTPNPARVPQIMVNLKAVKWAVTEGSLPLAEFIVDKNERFEAVKKVMVKAIRRSTVIA